MTTPGCDKRGCHQVADWARLWAWPSNRPRRTDQRGPMSRELGSFVTSQPPVEDQFTAGQEQRAERHSGAVLSPNLGPDRTGPDRPGSPQNTGISRGLSPSLCLLFFSATSQVSAQSWRPRHRRVVTSPAMTSQRDTVQINTKEHPPLNDTNKNHTRWEYLEAQRPLLLRCLPPSGLSGPNRRLLLFLDGKQSVRGHTEAPEVGDGRPAGRRQSVSAVTRPAAGFRPARDGDIIVARGGGTGRRQVTSRQTASKSRRPGEQEEAGLRR